MLDSAKFLEKSFIFSAKSKPVFPYLGIYMYIIYVYIYYLIFLTKIVE